MFRLSQRGLLFKCQLNVTSDYIELIMIFMEAQTIQFQ